MKKELNIIVERMKINIHSLKVKLVLSIAALFGFIILFSVINNIVAGNIIKKKTNNTIMNNITQTNQYIGYLIKKAKEIGFVMCINDDIRRLANQEYTTVYDEYMLQQDLRKTIMYQTTVNNDLYSICVYLADKKKLISSEYIYNDQTEGLPSWTETYRNIKESYTWIGYDEGDGKIASPKDVISFVARANIINRLIRTETYISVSFRESEIAEIIGNIKISPDTHVFVLNRNDSIISTEDKSLLGKNPADRWPIDLQKVKDNKITRIKAENKKYYQVIYQQNASTSFAILVFLPERHLLKEQRMFWGIVISVLCLITLIVMFLIFRIITRNVDKPVAKLMRFMQEVEKGNFELQINENRKDEFAYLYNSYNVMVIKLKQLVKQLYHENLLKKEMELKVLQNQINPHFLYNTLDTINWIAKANKVNDISQLVMSMSNMYRGVFNKGSDYITVEKMLTSMENYLYIQRFRCGSLFDYSFVIDERIKNYNILNLILQPVIENAVIHGIEEGKFDNGFIQVNAVLEDDKMHFTVKDNGRGIPQPKLNILKNSMKYLDAIGASGLRNVNKRLVLFYGEEAGLYINSEFGHGTSVEFYIPLYSDLASR